MVLSKDFWLNRYRPGTSLEWRGRSDNQPNSARYHEVVVCCDLRSEELKAESPCSFAFVGFASDTGVTRNQGRAGAVEGPLALRHSLSQFPIPSDKTCSFIDVGDIQCEDGNLEEAQEGLAVVVAKLLKAGITPIILGGGHEVAWAHYMGLEKAGEHQNLGIINFDAHFDLRPLIEEGLGTSGTPFLQMAHARQQQGLDFDYSCIGIQALGNTPALFATARELGTHWIDADTIHTQGVTLQESKVDEMIGRNERIMLSICMDVFASSVAPGVSAPQPLGLMPWQVLPLMQRVAASGRTCGLHVAELAPKLDHQAMTARLSAALVAGYVAAVCQAVCPQCQG